MANSPMYYEANPKGLKQAWKVQWVAPLGGYSETVHGTTHKIVPTIEEATQFANGLQAMNETLQSEKYKHICVERVFVLE